MIKVSGKYVSVLLGFLQKHLNEQDFSVLRYYHGIMHNVYKMYSIHLSYYLKIIIL